MVTPIGLDSIGGHYYWIWACVNALFIPLIYFFGVETAGRSLEMVDQMFIEEPRVCMGLNPNHRRVLKGSKGDEEARLRRSSVQSFGGGKEKDREGSDEEGAVGVEKA